MVDLLFAPGQATAWWANLDGEDNRKRTGRLLVHTLSDWLKKQPHGTGQNRKRMQYFFSSHAQSRVDRRFDGVGGEEKVIERLLLLLGLLQRLLELALRSLFLADPLLDEPLLFTLLELQLLRDDGPAQLPSRASK
ncbi:hypothetical protein [Polyangium aurulentum]|uniref:hypothetical protein n=1 Tax=Polyangium aurulentum TaxID=2567896 RepID=UPI001981C324|nr:hypothetical protein [Polyangium aurulentum]UQA61384.1 hypothetical protein E8A73_013275 [Polyangium aurulentum]